MIRLLNKQSLVLGIVPLSFASHIPLSSLILINFIGGDDEPLHELDVEAGAPLLGAGSEPRVRVGYTRRRRPGPEGVHARGRRIWRRISGLNGLDFGAKFKHKPKIMSFSLKTPVKRSSQQGTDRYAFHRMFKSSALSQGSEKLDLAREVV